MQHWERDDSPWGLCSPASSLGPRGLLALGLDATSSGPGEDSLRCRGRMLRPGVHDCTMWPVCWGGVSAQPFFRACGQGCSVFRAILSGFKQKNKHFTFERK